MEHTEAALCAKEVKKLLKEKYPTINFSVKSENFSMGNSVNVSWNFGPTDDEIENLISDFKDGHFDGMNDLYTYRENTDNKPRSKYVMTARTFKLPEELEITKENKKYKWNDPRYRDLWKEEKTFYHQVTRDLCALFGLEPMRPDSKVPADYEVMARGLGYITWSDVIHQLTHSLPLMTGYHGVRHKTTETGEKIMNVAEIY